MIIRIDKGFMGELQKKGYDLDSKNLAEVYQTFRHKQGERVGMVTYSEDEEEAFERHNETLF